jgi:predicted RNase H-like nuclease (RuvC/YqgF family)
MIVFLWQEAKSLQRQIESKKHDLEMLEREICTCRDAVMQVDERKKEVEGRKKVSTHTQP